jgi:DNA-binding LacI/PurR family transcriptional regulator
MLAERLGVSRATVSNAYNRPDQLSPQLRARILRTARELGYTGPDPTARALSRGSSGSIGMIFTEELSFAFSDPAAVQVLQGMATACQGAGVGLLLLPVSPVGGAEGREEAKTVHGASVDGLVIYSMPDEDPAVEAAMERRLPTVLIDQPRIAGAPFVGIDDRRAAREALEHLLDLGHERLGFIAYRLGPDPIDATVSPERLERSRYRLTRERFAGYQEALDNYAVVWEDIIIVECSRMTPRDGYDAAKQLLTRDDTPTALLTDSDQLALGALQAARDLAVAVPDELSIIGLDDIPAAGSMVPALTTIRQPLFDKGFEAGRLLLETPNKEEEAETLILGCELVVRDSTGRPRG